MIDRAKHIAPYNDEFGVPVPGPDRDEAAGRKLTRAQIIARKTNGVATLAMALSTSGAALTGIGGIEICKGNYATGLGAIAVGVMCDALDGVAARAAGVDSYKAGRYADAGLDGVKAAMVAGVGYATESFPVGAIALTYGPKLAGWATNCIATIRGKEAVTSKDGKVAEAVRWATPALFVGGYALNQLGVNPYPEMTNTLGWVASGISAGLGIKSTVGYVKSALSARRQKKQDFIDQSSNFVADPTDF